MVLIEVYPRLTVRSQDDPITEEEDSNSSKSDERAIESLSPVAHECLKSPVKQGNNSENRPHTSSATPSKSLSKSHPVSFTSENRPHTSSTTPSKSLSKSHPVSFTSTLITTTEKVGKHSEDKDDRPNLFLRPRAVVSSRDNDDLIALQNRRIEKKAPRVKKCYINPPSNRKEKNENKILGSVPVSATKPQAELPSAAKRKEGTKPQAQLPSTAKRKEGSATRRNVAVIARPN